MGRLRNVLRRIFDALDPPEPEPEPVLAPCPVCSNDVSKHHKKAQGQRDDLIFFLCLCGHASAWYWHDHGAQLIYGSEPKEIDDE